MQLLQRVAVATRPSLPAAGPRALLAAVKQTFVLEPGLVLIRGALDEHEQIALCKSLDTSVFLQSGESRLRYYDRIENFSEPTAAASERAAEIAASIDEAMPRFSATHVLANRYVGGAGLLYHRDIYANDGDGRAPIVNVCLGAPCRFGVRHVDETGSRGHTRELHLGSGDAIVFGGPCRFIEHAVLSVDLDQAPAWMADEPSRVSLTFREAPSVIGCEEYFRSFSTGGSFAEEQARWREGDALLGAPPKSEA